jgi:hypothetical protein
MTTLPGVEDVVAISLFAPAGETLEVRRVAHVPDSKLPRLVAIRIYAQPPTVRCPAGMLEPLERHALMAPTDRIRLKTSSLRPFIHSLGSTLLAAGDIWRGLRGRGHGIWSSG